MENYKIFYLKRKGKKRKIITYDNEFIKKRHEKIYLKLSKNFRQSIFTNGYVKNHSIYTNAKAHLYNNYFLKVDIKNFFPSINHNLLEKKLYKEIKKVATQQDCKQIIKECSIYNKGLPLGLITSPILSNIYLKQFDISLYKKISSINCRNIIYTRYADDMVISFYDSENTNKTIDEIMNIIKELLKKYNLKINDKKTKFISFEKSKQVRITGTTIVEKNGKRRLSVGRNQKRKLFYEAINMKKSKSHSEKDVNRLKGKLSFFLSIEKTNFEDFISENMKKEIIELGFDNFLSLVKNL